jgi:hypothetical protein
MIGLEKRYVREKTGGPQIKKFHYPVFKIALRCFYTSSSFSVAQIAIPKCHKNKKYSSKNASYPAD